MASIFDVAEAIQNCGYTNNNVQAAVNFLILHEDSFYEEIYDEIILTLYRLKDEYVDVRIALHFPPGKYAGNLTEEERIELWYGDNGRGLFNSDVRRAMIAEYTRLFNMVRENTISEEDFDFRVVQTIQPTGEIVWLFVGVDEGNPTISFYTELGEAPTPIEMPSDGIITADMLPVLEAEGYTHTGWRDCAVNDAIGTDYSEVGFSPVLYAVWEEASEEPTESISFINFLCSPTHPFLPKNLLGWKLAQKQGGGSAVTNVLTSSDGFALQDKNGLNLIPKEG